MYKQTQKHKSLTNKQHSFTHVETGINRERSTIDRDSRTTTAIDGGPLYPIYVDEVLPGDTYQLRCQTKGWLSTPIVPFLDNIYVSTFFFFVANRLVWSNWQKFQGETDDPGDSVDFTIPQIEIAGGVSSTGSLADYMGIPLNALTKKVNALPFRGVNLIWNEFFRDTHLQDSVTVDKGDADSLESNYASPLPRGRRKDYLTSCLPYPQAPGVGVLPGVISGVIAVTPTAAGTITLEDAGGVERGVESNTGTTDLRFGSQPLANGIISWPIVAPTNLEVNLDSAAANNINQLRQSIAIQQLLELDARGGNRYTEQLKARFGVTSSDQRLQRPEYLGGGQSNISMHPVPGTNQGPESPQTVGRLGAFGALEGNGGGFTHSFTEHGFIIGFVNIRTDYTYFEGLPRFWSRESRYDFYEPSLSHLGEQPVYNQEILVSNVDATDFGPLGVFGYQERFGEYKYGNSMVTGKIRPNATAGLGWWTLAEMFTSLPSLNAAFIEDNPSQGIDRVLAVPSEPHLIMDLYFKNRHTRVMPVHNTPGLTRL